MSAHQQRRGRQSTRRPASPNDIRTPIAVPLNHPELGAFKEGATAGGEYPLLTLSEQRQSLHSGSARASLQIERSGSDTGSNRISLPRSVSIDQKRKSGHSSGGGEVSEKVDKGKGKAVDEYRESVEGGIFQIERKVTIRDRPFTPVGKDQLGLGISIDRKGKAKANMSESKTEDLERGTSATPASGGISNLPHNASRTSVASGIGSAVSDGTSIIGSDGPAPDLGEEWGPQHPCFPHMNPHVPLSSPLYQTTRVIRIRRDWMIEGDLAPTFSNLYPEILEPAGVTEQDFRTVINKINKDLTLAFSPYSMRNIVDGFLGLITGWIWDDMGFTGVKTKLQSVEKYLEDWNRQMEARSGEGPGGTAQIVPLRRTGYMNVSPRFFWFPTTTLM